MTAKLRCEPGDLALVLRGLYTGSVVTVIELADEKLLHEIGVADNCRPCWVTDKPLDWGPHDEFRWALAPDTSLMPIRPEPDPCEIEHEEPAGRDHVPRFADVASGLRPSGGCVNANEILVEEPTDVSDERLVQEVTEATQDGHRASKTFADAQEANAEGQEWRDRFRKVLPADTINPVGILVDGERVVLFDATRWVRGGLNLDITSPDPLFHIDPRLLPPQH